MTTKNTKNTAAVANLRESVALNPGKTMGRAEIDTFIAHNTYGDDNGPGNRLTAATALAGLALVQKLELEMGVIDASIALAGVALLLRIAQEHEMKLFDVGAFDIECYIDEIECRIHGPSEEPVPAAA
jgi:hypothetical protein